MANSSTRSMEISKPTPQARRRRRATSSTSAGRRRESRKSPLLPLGPQILQLHFANKLVCHVSTCTFESPLSFKLEHLVPKKTPTAFRRPVRRLKICSNTADLTSPFTQPVEPFGFTETVFSSGPFFSFSVCASEMVLKHGS